MAWYERTLTIPKAWFRDPTTIVQVTFGAVGYETRVGLNGRLLHTVEGRLVSSLLTAHLYTADVAQWQKLPDRFVAGHNTRVAAEPLVVGDPFFYGKQVPLVVSEWGGFGFSVYGAPNSDDRTALTEHIRAFKHDLRPHPIAGDVYT